MRKYKNYKGHAHIIAVGTTAMVILMICGIIIGSATSANLTWKGMTRDIVGSGGSPNFDYNPDGYFTLSIDLGQETKTVDYISLKSVDARDNPTGDVWDTDPNTNYWRLAVEQPLGMLLNPTDTLIRKTVSGNTAFELYAANSGKFVLGNYFKATVRFTDGTSIDATTPIFEISREFPINLKWNGLISDKVGSAGNPNPDKNPDGYFTLSIDLGQETKTADYISLKSVDARDNPTGDVWDTDPNTNYWRLAVEQPLGMLLNPTDTLIRKTVSGNTAFELYAANNGKFVLGNYFKATIRFTDGTLIDATETIEDTNQTKTSTSSPIPSSTQISAPFPSLTSAPIQSINYSILDINKTSATAPEIKETIVKNLSNDILFLNGTALSVSGHGIKVITVNGNYVDTRNFYVNVTNENRISIMAMDNDGNITTKNISLTTNINSKTDTSNPTNWITVIGVIIAFIGLIFGTGLLREKFKKDRKK